jgi:hypothetical protein
MGAANFHREFTHQFATIAAPLDECRNDKTIVWTPARSKAFEELKQLFNKNILLQHVDWKKKIYLTTDASQFGVGAWIGQIDENGDLLPIICVSKKLDKTQRRWPATKRELYALMWSMKRLKMYLLGRHFIARVDHKPLVAMVKNKSTMLTEGWIEAIQQFNFTTEYLPGMENKLADALSRSYEGRMRVYTLKVDQQESNKWEAEKRGLTLPTEKEKKEIVERLHTLGHFGTSMLVHKIMEEGYWWPQMRKYIKQVLSQCQPCLRYDVQTAGYHPAMSITAEKPWDHIQIDLIGPVPTSEQGHSYIMTIVDVCTGYVVLRSLKSKNMETIAKSMWKVICEYGTPKILQSDNGAEFVNQVIKTMTVVYGIEHRLITAYHPSANGLVERMNREVSRMLKKYTEGTYAAWNLWIPLVQLSVNESISQWTNSIPFSLMFGRKFNNFVDFSKIDGSTASSVPEKTIQSWNIFQESVLPALNKRTEEVKEKQENRLNQRRQSTVLKPGTQVMLVDPVRTSKWDPMYEGPFEIMQQHRGGAYSVKDSLGRKVPRRFTIDMMKFISEEEVNQEQHYSVEAIRDHRIVSNQYEYLVKWKRYPEDENSWVKTKDFNNTLPIKKYWKKQQQK